MFSIEEARARGAKIEVEPWKGMETTISKTAKKIRDAKDDPYLAGHVGVVLRDAGRPRTRRAQAAALVRDYRTRVVYGSDPAMTERTASPSEVLCLANAKVCIPLVDCDDNDAVLGGMFAVLNWPVWVIDMRFGPDAQPHVLLEVGDEDGSTFYVDGGGSLEAMDPDSGIPVGVSPGGKVVARVDPFGPIPELGLGPAQPTFVGVGKSPNDKWQRMHEAASTCKHCRYYAWSSQMDPTRVGAGWHHPSCPVVRNEVGAAGWNPANTTLTLKAGDVLRASFDRKAVDDYSGYSHPANYLGEAYPELFGHDAPTFWATWEPGDRLPDDWPTADKDAKDEWHFRLLWQGDDPITIDFSKAADGKKPLTAGGLQLWLNENVLPVPAPPAPQTVAAPDTYYDPIAQANVPSPKLEEDDNAVVKTVVYTGVIAALGVGAWWLIKHHRKHGHAHALRAAFGSR